jgi:multicomponent Na+:H+ antiporter subunit D
MSGSFLPPAFIFLAGASLAPLLRGPLLKAWTLLVPALSFAWLYTLPDGAAWGVSFLGLDLVIFQVDQLSRVFGYIFHLIAFLGMLYAFHVQDRMQPAVALLYAGAALGVTFAGDLFTLFLFWETLTVGATFLIVARRTPQATAAAYRYLLVHAAGGLCLLTGIVLHVSHTGSAAFGQLGLGGPGSLLIFLGFGLNCAWPFLHAWLTDSYPEATISGTIFLSAFTTKTAVYVLARAFPGTEELIWIGGAMVAFPIFFAVIENDLRRVLAYSLINQVGYMVVGIGIGTELALNGAVAHAYAHILYKSLLFMAMGAVLFRTGKINATDLGGLYRTMPLTAIFCMIGAASISAFPLFSGFISKSMVLDAAAYGNLQFIWFILVFASAGVFHHAGIKIPFFAFFSHDSGLRPKEAPLHMLLAMGVAAFMCIFIGVYPEFLYSMLPYAVDYVPYTAAHVLAQSQLLFFSALAFTLLLLSGIYPAEIRAINIDADWFYRKGGRWFYTAADYTFSRLNRWGDQVFVRRLPAALASFFAEPMDRLHALFVAPYYRVTGKGAPVDDFAGRSGKGAYPVGGGVLLAVLFLALMSFLFFL